MKNCPPGYEPQKAIFYDATWQTVFDWRCIKCRDKHIKPSKHNEPCKICPRYFLPNKNRSACFDPYNELYLWPSDTTAIIGIVINLLGLYATLTILIIFIKSSAFPVVRSSNVHSSIAHLCGHICLFLVVPVVFIGKPTIMKCIFRPFVIGCLLTFVASLSFTKVQRLLFIFRAKIHLSRNKVRLSKAVEIFIITLLLIIQVTTFVISYVHKIPKLQSIRKYTWLDSCNKMQHRKSPEYSTAVCSNFINHMYSSGNSCQKVTKTFQRNELYCIFNVYYCHSSAIKVSIIIIVILTKLLSIS